MKLIKLAIIAVLVISATLFGILSYSGMFYTPMLQEQVVGSYFFVYEDLLGDYSKAGPVMDKIYKSLKEDGIDTHRGFGLYLDDPKKVSTDKLRSKAGSIIEENDYHKRYELALKYKTMEFPLIYCLTAEFPYKTMLSIVFGVMKVYPKLDAYFSKNSNKFLEPKYGLEVYDMKNKKILYAMPLEKKARKLILE